MGKKINFKLATNYKLNVDFVLNKICDLGAVSISKTTM